MDSKTGSSSELIKVRKTRAPADESKRDRFLRLAQPRVTRAIHAIDVIGLIGGANRYHYEYGQSDVEQMVQALDDAVTRMRDKLSRKHDKQLKFEFKG